MVLTQAHVIHLSLVRLQPEGSHRYSLLTSFCVWPCGIFSMSKITLTG